MKPYQAFVRGVLGLYTILSKLINHTADIFLQRITTNCVPNFDQQYSVKNINIQLNIQRTL